MIASVRGVFAVLGEERPLIDLPELAADPSTADELVRGGLRHYRDADGDLEGTVNRAVEGALVEAAVDPSTLGAVVFATGLPVWSMEDEGAVLRALAANGVFADIVGVAMSEAANTFVALGVAARIARESDRDVLLVIADVSPRGASRVTHPAVTVASDGAVAAVVATPGQGEAEVQLLSHEMAWSAALTAAPLGPETLDIFATFHVSGLRRLRAAADAESPAPPTFIVPGFHRDLVRMAANAAGIDVSSLYTGCLATNAHVQASDTLVTLSHLRASRHAPGQALVALFAAGRWAWSSAVVAVRST